MARRVVAPKRCRGHQLSHAVYIARAAQHPRSRGERRGQSLSGIHAHTHTHTPRPQLAAVEADRTHVRTRMHSGDAAAWLSQPCPRERTGQGWGRSQKSSVQMSAPESSSLLGAWPSLGAARGRGWRRLVEG